jgi:hypothetical protein
MNEQDEALKQLLQRAAPGHADRELKRDLWPEMRQRLAQPPVHVPWGDWAVAAAFVAGLLVFPATIPALLYLL